MGVASLWDSYQRFICPWKAPQESSQPDPMTCSGVALGRLIIFCVLCEAQHISIFLSLCAKMPDPKISIINDTIKSLARKSQVHQPLTLFRKLVRTRRAATPKSAQGTKDINFEDLKRGHWSTKFLYDKRFYLSLVMGVRKAARKTVDPALSQLFK